MRFDNSSDLFGKDFGTGTTGIITCDYCGTVYYPDDPDGNYYNETICFTHFGNKQVCDCCFEEIENAVLEWIPYILPWFAKQLESKVKQAEDLKQAIRKIKEKI